MNRFSICLFAFFIIIFSSITLQAQEEQKYQAKLIKKIYYMGTAMIDEIYFPIGQAISKLLSKNQKKIVVIAEQTEGYFANVEYLQKKRINLAFIRSDVAWKAYHNSFNELRVISSLYSDKIQIITRANSNITKLEDLKGKKIAIEKKGNGNLESAIQILELAGLKTNLDYELVFENFSNAVDLLTDGNIDAFYYIGPVPDNRIKRLSEKIRIRLIDIPKNIIDIICSTNSYYTSEIIDISSYQWQYSNINTLGFNVLLTTTDQLPSDEVLNMLMIIYSNPTIISEYDRSLILNTKIEDTLKSVEESMLHDGVKVFFQNRIITK